MKLRSGFVTEEKVREYVRKRKRENRSVSVNHVRGALGVGYKKAKRVVDEEIQRQEQPSPPPPPERPTVVTPPAVSVFGSLDAASCTFVGHALRFYSDVPIPEGGNVFHQLASAASDVQRKVALSLAYVMPKHNPQVMERDAQGLLPKDRAIQNGDYQLLGALVALEPRPLPSSPAETSQVPTWLHSVQRTAYLLYMCPVPEESGWTVKPMERWNREKTERQIGFCATNMQGVRLSLTRALEIASGLLAGVRRQPHIPGVDFVLLTPWLKRLRALVQSDAGLIEGMDDRMKRVLSDQCA
jgi:hypothetical protein